MPTPCGKAAPPAAGRRELLDAAPPVDNGIYLYPRPTSALVGNLLLLLTAYAFSFPQQASRSRSRHPGQPGLDSLDLVREDKPLFGRAAARKSRKA